MIQNDLIHITHAYRRFAFASALLHVVANPPELLTFFFTVLMFKFDKNEHKIQMKPFGLYLIHSV